MAPLGSIQLRLEWAAGVVSGGAPHAPPLPSAANKQQPAAAAPKKVVVTVPRGKVPGQTFQVKLQDGRVVDVPVPAGVQAGSKLTFTA